MHDAHMHIDQYDGDSISEVIEQIEDRQLRSLCVSMDFASYERICTLAEGHPLLIPAFGIHPWHAGRTVTTRESIAAYVKDSVVIGEAGLDFHWVKGNHQEQLEVFRDLCSAAAEHRRPMNLHTKGAESEVLQALRDHGVHGSAVHWYSGPARLIEGFLSMGCYFTIGVGLYHNYGIRELLRELPLERILFETDNPVGYRWLYSRDGMPCDLRPILEKASAELGISPERLERITDRNFERYLGSS